VAELATTGNPGAYTGLLDLASEALITIRRAKTDVKVAQKTGVIQASLTGPALLAFAKDDLAAVGKIAALTLSEADTVELTSIEMEKADE
jgi:valyl-tRNA synthetase